VDESDLNAAVGTPQADETAPAGARPTADEPNPHLVANQPPPAQATPGAVERDAAIAENPYVAVAHPAPAPAPNARFQLRITRVTSVVVMTHRKSSSFQGTYEQLEAAYKKVRLHNLLLGWWGIPFGLVWTPLTLFRNAQAFKKLRYLAGR
jgi:hypothetical protein